MTQEHPNAKLVQQAYQAFAAQDLATLRSVFAEDATWHCPGHQPLAGDHKGLDAIVQFLGGLLQASGGTFAPQVKDFVANDRHVVVVQQNTASRNGKTLDVSECVVFAIRDGKIADARGHFYDLYACDEFWA